jgi:hypothetical protein
LGEQADDCEDKPKGASSTILDLDGVKRPTRNKSDIPQIEKDLHFTFRAMNAEKWDYCMRTDLVLQPEGYRSMIGEQSISQIEDQHPAFTMCGLISRVQSLPLFSNKEKLKLFLIGSILNYITSIRNSKIEKLMMFLLKNPKGYVKSNRVVLLC